MTYNLVSLKGMSPESLYHSGLTHWSLDGINLFYSDQTNSDQTNSDQTYSYWCKEMDCFIEERYLCEIENYVIHDSLEDALK